MALLTIIYAAIICTIIWYMSAPKSEMQLGTLCLMYWGTFLMWLVDAAFCYAELGVAFFTPDPLKMLYDFYLGISVVALGLVIWIVILLVKDPKGVIKSAIFKRK